MKIIFSLLIVTLAEATIGVFVKLSGDAVPVATLTFYRLLFASLFLGLMMSRTNKNFWKFPKRNAKDTFIIGALIAGQITTYNIAMTLTTIANAVIFWSIAPFFVFIFSWLFLHEKAKREYVLIFLLALVGLVIANPFGGSGNALGNSIALLTGVIYAAAVTYLRNEGKTEAQNDVFWFMTLATLYLLPSVFIFGAGTPFATSEYSLFGLAVPAIVWIACLGIIATGVAYFFLTAVLKNVSANLYSLVDIIVSPLVAAILAYLIFREVPSNGIIYGGMLLLGSGFLLTRSMGKTRNKKDYGDAAPKVIK